MFIYACNLFKNKVKVENVKSHHMLYRFEWFSLQVENILKVVISICDYHNSFLWFFSVSNKNTEYLQNVHTSERRQF